MGVERRHVRRLVGLKPRDNMLACVPVEALGDTAHVAGFVSHCRGVRTANGNVDLPEDVDLYPGAGDPPKPYANAAPPGSRALLLVALRAVTRGLAQGHPGCGCGDVQV